MAASSGLSKALATTEKASLPSHSVQAPRPGADSHGNSYITNVTCALQTHFQMGSGEGAPKDLATVLQQTVPVPPARLADSGGGGGWAAWPEAGPFVPRMVGCSEWSSPSTHYFSLALLS